RSAVEQYAHDFALNHQRLQSSAASVSESNAEVASLQNIQSRLDTDSVNFSASAVTGFQNYLESEFDDKDRVARLMNATKPEDLMEVRNQFNEYTRSDAFQNAFGVSTSTSDIEDLGKLYQPNNLSETPTLSPEQQHGVNSGAANAKNKINEVTIDMINYQGSDELYDHGAYRNVKGNVLVAGGHMQNEADQPVTPTIDPNSDV
ncbi:conjugal transfer protein TraG, partial [Vibrio parahaemolyticus]|nr:conjugal transfer protein TraG [Vibrio parahaemolyticus]